MKGRDDSMHTVSKEMKALGFQVGNAETIFIKDIDKNAMLVIERKKIKKYDRTEIGKMELLSVKIQYSFYKAMYKKQTGKMLARYYVYYEGGEALALLAKVRNVLKWQEGRRYYKK